MNKIRIRISRPLIGDDEIRAVEAVLRSGRLSQGPEVEAFESEYSQRLHGRRCIAVNSGTSALHLMMLAMGFGPGDEVIVPSFTFAATANAVALTGATPVFADIEPSTYCLSPDAVIAVLSPRTVAIIAVHLFGHPADMAALSDVAFRHGLALLEDAAQAHGARFEEREAGTLGHAACFSFYSTKNITCGEGGLVVTSDEQVDRRVRLLRNQGMLSHYANEVVGFNNRMTDVTAAIARVQLRRLDALNEARQSNAVMLSSLLSTVTTPVTRRGCNHVFHQYTVRSVSRDELRAHLAAHGVETGVYYPTPVHALPAYGRSQDLPETERACREVLSLPVHPGLDASDIELIAEAVASA